LVTNRRDKLASISRLRDAEDHKLSTGEAIEDGMADKSAEFLRAGSHVYLPVVAAPTSG